MPKVVEKFGADGSLQNVLSFLGARWCARGFFLAGKQNLNGNLKLVNFCRRTLSGETLCKVIQIFPPKDFVYIFKFSGRLYWYTFNKYYIIIYPLLILRDE